MRKPPRRMRADARAHPPPFRTNFTLTIVNWTRTKHAAEMREAQLIAQFATRGEAGYNTLPSTPARSFQFWTMLHRGAFV